jgi:hypothetical protein
LPRKKKSISEMVLNGSAKHNKGRIAQRLKEAKAATTPALNAPPSPVPDPPSHLTPKEKAIWAELAPEMDLTSKVNQSRFEMVCRLTRKLRQRQANGNELGQLNGLLQQLKKVTTPATPEPLPKELEQSGIDRCKNPRVKRCDRDSGCGYTNCDHCQELGWHAIAARFPGTFFDNLIDEYRERFLARYPDFDRDDPTTHKVVADRITAQLL